MMTDEEREIATIVLGIMRSPGVVTLSGHDRNEAWDTQAAKGQTGASSSLNGTPIGQFQASFYLADEEDFAAWGPFQRLVESTTRGPAPVALPIYHPDLASQGFTEVCSAGVGAPIRDGTGGRTIVVKFIEYKPPKPKPSAKAKAKPGTAGVRTGTTTVERPDPNAAAKAELAALMVEAREPV